MCSSKSSQKVPKISVGSLVTGMLDHETEWKEVKVPFGKYIITLKLTHDNKFLDLISVEIKTDFRSPIQRIKSTDSHDVDDFYVE